MSDLLILGGVAGMAAVDAMAANQSNEPASSFKLATTLFIPQTKSGEAEFRRLYVTVVYEGPFDLNVTPVVDGVPRPETSHNIALFSDGTFSDGTFSDGTRKSFMLPLGVTVRGMATGLRGTTLGVEIEGLFANQTGKWHIESVEVVFKAGHRARTNKVN